MKIYITGFDGEQVVFPVPSSSVRTALMFIADNFDKIEVAYVYTGSGALVASVRNRKEV